MAKLRIFALFVLLASAAMFEAIQLSSLSALSNSDIWWHMSSGLWILHHHALPQSAIFSQSSTLSWIASSWVYDLLLATGYKVLGLRSIPVVLICFKTSLGVVTFLLAGGLRGKFWPAVLLSAIAQYILGSVQPSPAYCSILFFAVELLLLWESRRTRSLRRLFWLPPLFLVWANVHIQFVDGVALLLLFIAALGFEQGLSSKSSSETAPSLPLAGVAKIAGVSLVATLVTPYFSRPYQVFFATTFNSANRYLMDFHAPGFRQPQDYALLLLAMSAFLVLGLRRSRDVFQIALLVACIVPAFYSERDSWLIVLAALAVIGEAIAGEGASELSLDVERRRRSEALLALSTSIAVLAMAIVLRIPRSYDVLMTRVGQRYPVAACDYIRQHRTPQPLFNAYDWGGFLTWYLPEYPVAIDGRADLYGEEIITSYSKAMNADIPYTAYPAMSGAQTILLPKNAIMAGALSSLPVFKVAYSDNLSVVLIRNTGSE